MHQQGHDSPNSLRRGPDWSRLNQWLLWLGLAAAVAWLVARHGAHLLEVSPFLLLLACPLLHLFGTWRTWRARRAWQRGRAGAGSGEPATATGRR